VGGSDDWRYERIGIELARAFVTVRADSSRLSSDFGKVQKKTGQLMSGISSQIRGMLAGLGVIGLGAAFVAAGREAATFEDTMIFVRANARLLGKEGEKSFRQLEAAARKMGATTRFTAVQAAEGLNQLVLGGLKAKDAIVALSSVLNLAASANLGLGESAKIVVDNMIVYGLAANDTARIADFLSSAQSRAQITARDLADGLQSLGSIASEMGANFNDVVTILTSMGRAGADMRSAGTALAMALARMTDKTGPATAALKSMDVEIRNFTKPGGGIDLIPLFRDIADKMPTDPIERGAKAIEIFGIKGKIMLGIFGLMRRGRFVEETAKGLEDDLGRAALVAAARMDTFLGIVFTLKSALSDLAIAGLTPVLKAIEPMIGVFIKLTGAISFLTEKFSELNKMSDGFISTLVLATLGTFAFVRAILLIGPAARIAAAAVKLATISSGWGIIIVAIGLVIASLITLGNRIKKMDSFQKTLNENADKFKLIWIRIKQVFTVMSEAVIEAFNIITSKIAEVTGIDIPKLVGSIEQVTADMIGFIADFALDTVEWFLVILKNSGKAWEALKGGFSAAVSFMGDILSNFVDMWIDAMKNIGETVIALFTSIPKLAKKALLGENVLGEIKKIVSEGMEGAFDVSKLLDPSKRTKKILRDNVEGAFGDLLEEKIALEKGRKDLLPKKVAVEDPLQDAIEQGEAFGQAAGNQIDNILTSLIGERLGFREFGKTIQDALIKGGKDDKDEKRNSLLEQGNKRQEDLIKAVKDLELQGALT